MSYFFMCSPEDGTKPEIPLLPHSFSIPPTMREVNQTEAISIEEKVIVGPSPDLRVDEDDGSLLIPSRRVQAEKRLVRMLDLRLLPAIILVFITNYIDVSCTTAENICFGDMRRLSENSGGRC